MRQLDLERATESVGQEFKDLLFRLAEVGERAHILRVNQTVSSAELRCLRSQVRQNILQIANVAAHLDRNDEYLQLFVQGVILASGAVKNKHLERQLDRLLRAVWNA